MNKKSLFKKWLLGLVSLFAVLTVTACIPQYPVEGTVVEKEYEPDTRRYDHNKQKWVGDEECFELDIYDHEADAGVERCVSEQVFNDAMLGHKITLTEEYH